MQEKQRGLECPELALASCLPSIVNDQQQVEQANGESNKPRGSRPPSCMQSVLLLCLWRTWDASAAIFLWPWLLESAWPVTFQLLRGSGLAEDSLGEGVILPCSSSNAKIEPETL